MIVNGQPPGEWFLANLWRRRAGLPEFSGLFEELSVTQWSTEFERLMRNRLMVGAMRYGRMGAPDKPKYDRLGAIKAIVDQYEKTGNDELLVDGANLFMLEYREGDHPKKHFNAVDDAGHVAVKRSGE